MKKQIILILSIFTLIGCDTASVDLDDDNYLFDGRGGVKCDVDGIELKPEVRISPPLSSELRFESYMGEEYITLRFYNTDENNDFLSVRMVVKGFNPNEINLEEMTIDLNDYSTGELSINNQIEFSTNLDYVGEFEIVYHDQNERILAGRFWYDVINSENEIKEIRNGEFDMKY